MAKYTFISEDSGEGDPKYVSDIIHSTGDLEVLSNILYHFQSFLAGCGFVVNGRKLVFVEGESTDNL